MRGVSYGFHLQLSTSCTYQILVSTLPIHSHPLPGSQFSHVQHAPGYHLGIVLCAGQAQGDSSGLKPQTQCPETGFCIMCWALAAGQSSQ